MIISYSVSVGDTFPNCEHSLILKITSFIIKTFLNRIFLMGFDNYYTQAIFRWHTNIDKLQ